jgi:hypothetical protein
MLVLVLSLAALSLSADAPSPESLDEDALIRELHSCIFSRRESGPYLDALILRFRESPRVPAALLEIGRSLSNHSERRGEALPILSRLQNEFPGSKEAAEAIQWIEKAAGWRFVWLPEHETADAWRYRGIEVSRGGGPASVLTFSRIPWDEFRMALEAVPPGELPRAGSLAGDRPIDRTVLLPSQWGPSRTSTGTSLKAGGMYLAEERIEGFRRHQLIRFQSFGVHVRSLPRRTIFFAFDPQDGSPVEDVVLLVRGKERAWSAITGNDGLAFQDGPIAGTLIATRGEEVGASVVEPAKSADEFLAYITTDRPIYRPGQTVHWKVVRRDRKGGSLTFEAGIGATVEVRCSSGRVLRTDEGIWSEAGTFSGSFSLAADAPLGTYGIVARVPKREGFSDWDDDPVPYWRGNFKVAASGSRRCGSPLSSPAPLPSSAGRSGR